MLCISAPLFSQLNPPTGAQYLDLYRGPRLLGAYPNVACYNGPMSLAGNPALGAWLSLPEIEVSYTGLVGAGSDERARGYRGHLVNSAALLPTRRGAVGVGLNAFRSTLLTASLGTGIELGASFSKAVLPGLFLGAEIRSSVATQNDASPYAARPTDWGLTAGIGFVHVPAGNAPDGFTWGARLSGIGKGLGAGSAFDYSDADGATIRVTSYPPTFTLDVGFTTSLISVPSFSWDFSADASFPSFQNVEVGVATNFRIADFMSVTVGTAYNLRELLPKLPPNRRSFVPGFSLSVDVDAMLSGVRDPLGLVAAGYAHNTISPTVAFAPTADAVYAFSLGAVVRSGVPDDRPPTIRLDYPGFVYLSPRAEGFAVRYPLSISDARYVTSYAFWIVNGDGEEIWRVEDRLPRFGDPAGSYVDRVRVGLAHVYRSIDVPEEVFWNGRLADGSVAPDGRYELFVESGDDRGNIAEAGPFGFALDGTPPTASITLPEFPARILSPNNDGNKDTITIRLSGSVEDLWLGEILQDDESVREYRWIESAPDDVVWDGTDSEGNVLPDGTYRYRLQATDRAGNRTALLSEPFVLSTTSTPIAIGIDRAVFSPNGDGVFDELTFSIDVPVQTGIVRWTAAVLDQAAREVRAIVGSGKIPDSIRFDGRDETGAYVKEGAYYGALSVLLANGNHPAEVSPIFEVDVTPPLAVVTSDLQLFSPNGDGNKDLITFFQDTTEEELWTAEITNASGALIYSTSWRGTADRKFIWDGHAQNGLLARNGTHFYRLTSVDRAGNSGTSNVVEFEVNYEETPVIITRALDAFSPNADGVFDAQSFSVRLEIPDGIESYTLSIVNENGEKVRTIAARRSPRETIVWQGVGDDGGRVPDGTYYATITILYANGNRPSARTRPFVIDTEVPTISVATDTTLFSPNNDGNRDTVTLTSRSSAEELWEGWIKSADGREVRTIYWQGRTSSYVWNGTDEAGNLVPDGIYYFEIATTDAAGNSARARTRNVRLDTRLTAIYLSTDRTRFSPNGDGVDDSLTLTMSTAIHDGVESWLVEIFSKEGEPTRSFSGKRIPERIIWDGRDSHGVVREGEFYARYSVRYRKGDTPAVDSDLFYIDVSAPELTIITAPTPFSPDGDGVDDYLVFTIGAVDASELSDWEIDIRDPKGHRFRRFAGTGSPPRSLRWDGISGDGERVLSAEEYRFTMTVADVLGNRTRARGVIPVDILVVREDGRFRIRVSSIIFEPSSPMLESENPQTAGKNEWVLGRIAEILTRYGGYRIRIEAHVGSVFWDDPERAAVEQERDLVPLSKARADTVKAALVARGIAESRITTEGLGGAKPVVPHGDDENRWKNRRIEFILFR